MEKTKPCKERVDEYLRGRIEDLKKLMENDRAGIEDEEIGNLNEYGLCFDYVAKGTFTDQKHGFFRYQLSTGGPGDEFRFYLDEALDIQSIEYWFLDWFDGAYIKLSGKNQALLEDVFDYITAGDKDYIRKLIEEG